MNFFFVMAATVALISAPLAFFFFLSAERYRKRATALELELATTSTQAGALKKESDDIKTLRDQNALFLEQKSIAVTERLEMERKVEAMRQERDSAQKQKDEAIAARLETDKQRELVLQRMTEAEKRMQDWELQRVEGLKATKASILEAGGQLSSKLLEDHKREAEAAKKDNEAVVKKTSEALIEQLMNVTKSVAELKGQTTENRDKMATVWKALTTPSGAGYLAEVGLENSLKNFKLIAGRDYIMQYSVKSEELGSLRPDAVIFLPQDMVMVIDSKASKFLIEIAQAQEIGSDEEVLASLKKTMNKHLSDLAQKSYATAIQAAYKQAGRSEQISKVFNVMYLPSDSAVLHIKRADPEFINKTEQAGIILAGPASLSGLISLAQLNIGMARQAANQDKIVENVQDLMDNLITVLNYAEKVGRGLKSASDNFDQFARSVNRRLLPKVQKLASLGVKPAKAKEIPGRITSYEMRLSDDPMIIEGEAEAVEEMGVIEAFPKQKISA